jgi:hypothetical protein
MSRDGRRHGLETVVGDHKPNHASTDAEGSSDEWQSPSSGEEIGDGGPLDRGRLEMVDRIMKSFCASLDSKIAVAKMSSPAIKEEREAAVEHAPQAINTTAMTGLRQRSFFGCRKASPLSVPPLQAPPARPPPPFSGGSSGQRISAPAPPPPSGFKRARRDTSEPPVATDAQQSQDLATAGAGPAVPETGLANLMRRARRPRGAQNIVSHSPPAPAPSRSPTGAGEHTPTVASEQRTADSLLPPSISSSTRPRSNRRYTKKTRSRSGLDSAITSETSADEPTEDAYDPFAWSRRNISGRRERSNAGIESEDEEAHDPSHLYDRYMSQTGRPSNAGRRERSNAGIESEDEVNSFAPTDPSTMPDLFSTYAPFPEGTTQSFDPETQLESGDVEARALRMGMIQPIDPEMALEYPETELEYGDAVAWTSRIGRQRLSYHLTPDVSDILGSGPVHSTPTLVRPAAREWPGMPQESPEIPQEWLEMLPEEQQDGHGTKRVAEQEETQQGPVHVHEEADGDGRRKKAKRAVLDTVGTGEGTQRKFACPYFQRNPKKYRKWTSCPGPGWDEVHRVKYGCQRAWQV